MSDVLVISSHKGPYEVAFNEDALASLDGNVPENAHIIVDSRVAALYERQMGNILSASSVLKIDAREENKSLDQIPRYVEHLVAHGIRRDHILIAIGGGIIQDITCFLSATLLRGVDWWFLPTTLLAQADSCIGSKSSINCGRAKNILGTFTPPRRILLSTRFLETLAERDVRSGVGEILKVHAIDGPASFSEAAREYDAMFRDPAVMVRYIRRALGIKKRFIETDEFDRGPRNIFNYGHSFGHAIEAATDFAVPHGIAVSMGMDMANYTAWRLGVTTEGHYRSMHVVLRMNYDGFEATDVPLDRFLAAISKDKKNMGSGSVTLILPDRDGRVFKDAVANDAAFATICRIFLDQMRAA